MKNVTFLFLSSFFGDMAKKKNIMQIITIHFFYIDNYHDKCKCLISFQFFWRYDQKEKYHANYYNIFFISVDSDNYHKCHIFIYFDLFWQYGQKNITLIITIFFFISANIDNYPHKCQSFCSFKVFWQYGKKKLSC